MKGSVVEQLDEIIARSNHPLREVADFLMKEAAIDDLRRDVAYLAQLIRKEYEV